MLFLFQVGLRHKISDDLMIYPGYVPREGVEPILLHYGLPFTVGNWSFTKFNHREDGIVYDCGRLFPKPPYPEEVLLIIYSNRCMDSFVLLKISYQALYHHRSFFPSNVWNLNLEISTELKRKRGRPLLYFIA